MHNGSDSQIITKLRQSPIVSYYIWKAAFYAF